MHRNMVARAEMRAYSPLEPPHRRCRGGAGLCTSGILAQTSGGETLGTAAKTDRHFGSPAARKARQALF